MRRYNCSLATRPFFRKLIIITSIILFLQNLGYSQDNSPKKCKFPQLGSVTDIMDPNIRANSRDFNWRDVGNCDSNSYKVRQGRQEFYLSLQNTFLKFFNPDPQKEYLTFGKFQFDLKVWNARDLYSRTSKIKLIIYTPDQPRRGVDDIHAERVFNFELFCADDAQYIKKEQNIPLSKKEMGDIVKNKGNTFIKLEPTFSDLRECPPQS